MYEKILYKLSLSKFRNSFNLKERDKKYVIDKGLDTIKLHAYEFINKRLSANNILNDGKQTPFKGHPVFIAQHATATCCRECLFKWHKIPKNTELNEKQKQYIVDLIIKWIEKELDNFQ